MRAASQRHPRAGRVRLALLTVAPILMLGFASGRIANSGEGNGWFDLLAKPALMPPGWVFGLVWSILYVAIGIALFLIIEAPPSNGRRPAIALFCIQLALNLAWSPVFFALHRIMLAFGLVVAMVLWAGAATWLFWHIRRAAALLMLPYLGWLLFAGILTWQVHRLNPQGAALAPSVAHTQISIQ